MEKEEWGGGEEDEERGEEDKERGKDEKGEGGGRPSGYELTSSAPGGGRASDEWRQC